MLSFHLVFIISLAVMLKKICCFSKACVILKIFLIKSERRVQESHLHFKLYPFLERLQEVCLVSLHTVTNL